MNRGEIQIIGHSFWLLQLPPESCSFGAAPPTVANREQNYSINLLISNSIFRIRELSSHLSILGP